MSLYSDDMLVDKFVSDHVHQNNTGNEFNFIAIFETGQGA